MIGEPQQNISFAEFELDIAHRRLLRNGPEWPSHRRAAEDGVSAPSLRLVPILDCLEQVESAPLFTAS